MNKVILMGRLTRDPELRTTNNNVSRCTFTIAVDRRYKNAQGEYDADFIQITSWRQQAEFAAKYLTKGTKVLVTASIQNNNWTDADGKKHYDLSVVADDIEFAESKKNSSAGDYSERSARPYQGRQQDAPQQNAIPAGDGFLPVESDDTSLPFDL